MRDRATWEPIARQAADAAGFDPDIFAAVIDHESGFDPEAVSHAGAIGIAQIVPRWHPNVDPRDPVASLHYSANLLAAYRAEFGSDTLALAAYNAGPSLIREIRTVPDYPETVAYIRGITDDANAMRSAARATDTTGATTSTASTGTEAPNETVATSEPSRVVSGLAALAVPGPVDRRTAFVVAAMLAALVLVAVRE